MDPDRLPRIISDELFQAAGRVATDNTKWSPRRAEPGAWLLKGLVKCGVCGVGTSCHKMRGRNGTWHRYYYCRNHDPLRAGGESRRCPERNIRADALDAFVFDHIRTAITHPDQLLAGEQAVSLRTPIRDDELLTAELARLDRKIDAADTERRRLIDLYQGGFIELPEMQRRAGEVSSRRKELQHKRTSLAQERTALARDNQLRRRVHDFAARIHAVIDTLDDTQKQQLLRLLIEDVRVTGWHVQIRLRIALDPPPPSPPHPTGPTGPTNPTPRPSPRPLPVSTKDGLRSLGLQLGPVVERVLLVGIILAFFGGGLVVIVTNARLVYAMARDQRFPGYKLMQRVNPRTQTPIPATILYFALRVFLLVAIPGDALLKLIESGTLNEALLYGMTIILYLAVRKRLGRREGAFDLGRFETLVAVSALVWSALVIFFVIAGSPTLTPVWVIGGLVLAGGVYFAYMWLVKPEVLENEPGEDLFKVEELTT
jgi:hypothetical protein